MRFSVLTAAGLIGAAVAAPAPGPAPLNFDDVIVVGEDGTHTVMKASEYDALERRAALPVAPAPALGDYGLVVSQPNVRRVTGNIFSGCTDSPTVDAFTSDSYSDQSYGNLAWVKGVIRLCNSTTYPVPYCIGQGEHK
ncbi:hypothetical protein CSIM01_09692 [Colletotrichum simmondsii]|uniref:Uncharacterized protein n=2 Tax=Colletotrichum acutatum species complex TaxID=2707335 RepID=A0A135TBT1_9PEZI|nr:hypothetical protein CNYM01_07537 [Colletotrichum nymphaeae SA-01]KXH45623.1 hypothetical protein CSIM01_09692 [Colletotrichum simmondsii]